MPEDFVLEPHRIQLEAVWLRRSVVARRGRRPDETSDEIRARVRVVRPSVPRKGPVKAFSCRVDFVINVPIFEDETLDAHIQVMAALASDQGVRPAEARTFSRTQVAFLVWPFARAFLAQLSSMAGASMPMLPLVVVPNALPAES